MRRSTFLALAAIALTASVTMLTRGMPTDVFWRTAALWSFLLLPFTARTRVELPRFLRVRREVSPRLIAAALLMIVGLYVMQIELLARPAPHGVLFVNGGGFGGWDGIGGQESGQQVRVGGREGRGRCEMGRFSTVESFDMQDDLSWTIRQPAVHRRDRVNQRGERKESP